MEKMRIMQDFFGAVFPGFLLCFALNVTLLSPVSAQATLPAGFAQQRLAEGLDPTGMAEAPDGRIFLLEKNGRVLIVRDGALLPDPFLSIPVDNYNERGLSGIAFDPEFEFNHYVYLFYTVPGAGRNRVSRFKANGDFAIPGSEEILLELNAMPGTIHNAGAMAFGPDGKLYIAAGDGADANAAQRLDNLLGKILRINPDGSIPEDNPFFDRVGGVNRAIWATGLRNPFSLALQPGSGRVFINDVGASDWEEVNEIVRGGNYGWPIIEGPRTHQQPPAGYEDPLYAYRHSEGCAVVGAAFYNPELPIFPERYHGKYFFGDYCEGYVKVLDPGSGEVPEVFARGIDRPVALLVGRQGELYYLARAGMGGGSQQDNTSSWNGSLWKITFTGDGAPFFATAPASLLLPIGEDAVFEVIANGAPPLRYQWERDGSPIPGADAARLVYPNVRLEDDGSTFRCVVNNDEGRVVSAAATLSVTANTRPTPALSLPVEGQTYIAGDTLFFAGLATDLEDGELDASRLSWRIDFHHDDHTHPAMGETRGLREGYYIIPQVGEIDHNVWYRVYLSAIDSEGLSRTIYRDVYPVKTQFTVLSDPPGLEVNIDGRRANTPHTVTSVVGIRRTLSSVSGQRVEDRFYQFAEWHDGWASPFYTFLAGEVDTILARYAFATLSTGNGGGLRAEYFQARSDNPFSGAPAVTRIDTLINFNWEWGAPDERLEPDHFTARWTGEVQAMHSGLINFHTVTDDGVRLWVNNRLIIDQWTPQPATEVIGMIELEGGKRYPIRMEYFEAGGLAEARLLWSSDLLPRTIVPKSQLYAPVDLSFVGSYQVKVFPNPSPDKIRAELLSKIRENVRVQLFDSAGRLLRQLPDLNVGEGENTFDIDLSALPGGMYILRLDGTFNIKEAIKIYKF